MEDPNAILTLVADIEPATTAFGLPHNIHRYSPPSFDPEVSSRETTPFLDAEEQNEKISSCHRLHLTFDKPPRNGQEYVFGTDPRVCDVLLGKRRGEGGISGKHFCITFDSQRRVILRDFSTGGTAVSYDGQASGQKRSHFTWIIFEGFEKIEVKLSGTGFKFQIVLAKHEECESEYLAHVDASLEKRRTLEESGPTLPPFDMLDIHSQNTTAAPTAPRSPNQGHIYILLEELGRGGYGRVSRVIDASTGNVYAGKGFLYSGWEVEVAAMKRISHERIVQFVDFRPEPAPLLVMEYLSLGSLYDQHRDAPIAVEEAVILFYEGSQGIDYLHSQGIAHRDIKPGNILVVSRPPFSIKLSDFGLAKDASVLATRDCGTEMYMAPEVWEQSRSTSPVDVEVRERSRYTPAIDIWSFGLVVFEFIYGRPKFRRRGWCERVAKAAEDCEPDGLVDYLATRMLQVDPKKRAPASECLEKASEVYRHERLLQYMRDREAECTTPTEKATTFQTESYGTWTTRRGELLQLVPSDKSHSSHNGRSRKRQKPNSLSSVDGRQRVSKQRTPVKTSLEEAAPGSFAISVREPVLTGAPGYKPRQAVHQDKSGIAHAKTIATGTSRADTIKAGSMSLPTKTMPASAVRHKRERRPPTRCPTRIGVSEAASSQRNMSPSERDLYELMMEAFNQSSDG